MPVKRSEAEKGFDEFVDRLRQHWNASQTPVFLSVVIDYERRLTETAFVGNVTDIVNLMNNGLLELLPHADDMIADCDCPRCRQNLEKLLRAATMLQEKIAADGN